MLCRICRDANFLNEFVKEVEATHHAVEEDRKMYLQVFFLWKLYFLPILLSVMNTCTLCCWPRLTELVFLFRQQLFASWSQGSCWSTTPSSRKSSAKARWVSKIQSRWGWDLYWNQFFFQSRWMCLFFVKYSEVTVDAIENSGPYCIHWSTTSVK